MKDMKSTKNCRMSKEKEKAGHHQNIMKSYNPIQHMQKFLTPQPLLLTDRFMKIVPVTIGRSATRKYIVEDKSGLKAFLKIEPIENYSNVKKYFLMLEKLYSTGVITPQPIEYGKCEEGAYILSNFVGSNNNNLGEVLPHLTDEKRYLLGRKAGRLLKKIHQAPLLRNKNMRHHWNERFPKWAKDLAELYIKSPNKLDGYEYYLEILRETPNSLNQRSSCFLHFDYGSHNLLLQEEKLWAIDFGSIEAKDGDPYYDFRHIFTHGSKYPYFSTGAINGYFEGHPPEDFFKSTRFYLAWDIIKSSLRTNDTAMIESIAVLAKNCLLSYDNMKLDQPSWYF